MKQYGNTSDRNRRGLVIFTPVDTGVNNTNVPAAPAVLTSNALDLSAFTNFGFAIIAAAAGTLGIVVLAEDDATQVSATPGYADWSVTYRADTSFLWNNGFPLLSPAVGKVRFTMSGTAAAGLATLRIYAKP